MQKQLAFRLLWGLLCALLSSCVGTTQPQETALRIQLGNEPVSLDPTLAEDGVSWQILANTYEGLVGYDGQGQLQNRIAESYTVSADGKQYEFVLKKGAKWSDGSPVEAGDFVAALRQSLSPEVPSKFAALLYPIRGAKNYHEGHLQADLGIHEKDGKLQIELEYAAPYFIHALTLPITFPRPKSLQQGQPWSDTAPSNGPYHVVLRQLDRKVVLEANPYYKMGRSEQQQPKIKRIEFIIVLDESTGLNLFESGRLDILTRVPSLDLPRLRRTNTITSTPTVATYFLAFNCRKKPFDDVKWRRAFAATVQKEEIVKILDIGSNWGANRGSNLSTETDLKPAHSWIPHGLEGFAPHSYDDTYEHSRTPIQIQQNPDVEWLKHNGTKAYSGNIDVGFDNGARNSKIIEKFQYDINKTFDSFFKNSNIKTTLFHQDWKSYLHTLQTNPPHLYRFAWIAPFMDPITHLQIWTRENANNYSGCFDERYDHLVSEIEKMKPGPQRNKKINEAQRILIKEQAFVVPIYHYVQYTGVSERVGGFHMNQSGIIDLSGLYFYSKQ